MRGQRLQTRSWCCNGCDQADPACLSVALRALILPCSGDVGLGLNARRLRESFIKNFVVTYSLRPIADIGSVYRRYPGLWKVFLEEENLPGRYRMIAEVPSRPAGEHAEEAWVNGKGFMACVAHMWLGCNAAHNAPAAALAVDR